MIKILLKKQLSEIFKAYFVDVKKNKARSRASTALMFVLFAFLMIVVMGAVFGSMAFAVNPLIALGYGWLYYAITGLIAVLFGVFGSVFSTYSGLYLAKDNDLLFSMPIPVSAIITSRLLGVYLMGLMYSAVVIIPAVVVRFFIYGADAAQIAGAVLYTALISLFVLALSCIFGYLVARISLKLKNKSFITVIISVLFFATYYYVYFHASTFLSTLIKNIEVYGEAIKSKAYPVYIIGMSAEGDALSAAIVAAAVALLLFITLFVISRSFLKIATSTGAVSKVKYKQKNQRVKSQSAALLSRETKRFISSPNYMLNCGLSVLLMPAAGIFLLIKSGEIRSLLSGQFAAYRNIVYAGATALIFLLISINDSAAPSVSLEGKTLWQIRALPVETRSVLRAKYLLQIFLNTVPALFLVCCAVIALKPGVTVSVFFVLLTAVYCVFHALFSLYCGLHKINLNWTNEVVPIKQSLNVVFAIFGGWGYSIAAGALYFLVDMLGVSYAAELYMAAVLIITLCLSLLLYRWVNSRGVRIFEEL